MVPPQGRERVIVELHSGHPEITKMKALMRGLVWWPGIDTDIVKLVKHCSPCQQTQPSPPLATLHPWEWPQHPWSRLHVDFAGPIEGKMLLVVIDAYSKWVEAIPIGSTTAASTIIQLHKLLAQFGLPTTTVSDNGPQLTAQEFEDFCSSNSIKHIRVTPYHPSSNGLAERAARVVKEGLNKQNTSDALTDRLARVLLSYRITHQSTTRITPTELVWEKLEIKARFIETFS